MARRRMISPEIWESEDFSSLPLLARLLFIGMFSIADDYGKGKGNASYLKSKVFPFDSNVREADIKKSLEEIAATMSTRVYLTNGGKCYYQMMHWSEWQTISHPTESKIPDYIEGMKQPYIKDSTNIPESFQNVSRVIPESLHPNIKEDKVNIKDTNVSSCAELKNSAPEPVVAELLLNDKTIYGVTSVEVEHWKSLYPAVDVLQELREMQAWCEVNPTKRKTRKGIKRFITSWLGKEQDKGGRQVAKPKSLPQQPTKFHNFEQRNTDYDALLRDMRQTANR